MNPTAIYSKTGKGVQEASGKTSQLSRGDRAILSAIDGKVNLKDLSAKFDRAADDKFFALIKKMDADGFIREVNPGVAQRGAANAPKPATPAKAAGGAGEELDFTQIFSAPPKQEKSPASAAPAGDAMAQARHEAEMRQRAERDAKTKAEAAAKAMAEMAMKERSDAEARAKAAREATMQAAAEGKTKAEIEARTLAEARAKADADRQAKERAERDAREAKERAEHGVRDKAEAAEKARRDAADRARREADDLRRKVEEERRAREEAERRAREEAERTKRETEERARRDAEEKKSRQEAEELRQKLDEERKAREEAERKAQEEREKREREREAEDRRVLEEQEKRDAERRVQEQAERKERDERDRREQEENQRQIRLAREAEDRKRRDADARKKKEQDAKRWEQEDARRKSDGAYRVRAELEDKERAEREAVESVERAQAEKKAAEAADALAGSLMVDLDSFSKREEEERKEREQNERKQRAEEQRRAKEDEARHEREETERRVRKEEDKRRKEEEEHRQKEQKEAAEREAEAKAKEEEAERKKKKREAEARKAESGDIPISSADLGRDDISDDERKLTPEARKALRDREREVGRARSRGDQTSAKAASAYRRKQPVKWGKPVALALFFLLVGGVGVVNFLPLSTGEYEKLATDAIGHPVKIGSARMWVLAGVQMRFERVSIGETIRIAEVRAVPELGALLDENKAFSRIEMDKVTLPQESLGALFGAMQGSRLRVARVVAKEVKLVGPLALPTVDFDAAIGSDGRVNSVRLSGERISGLITPKGDDVAFEATLGTFTIPFIDKLSVSEFGMKGSANRRGMTLSEFDGRLYDGLVVGKGRIQWGAQWSVQGEIQGKAMNAAVFSPQMISEGRFDGKGRFTLAGPDPAKLAEGARLEGTFTVAKGALSSFDLSRALQSTSAQASGRTQFSALEGSAALANGALALRDLKLTAGILNANGTLDVDAAGGLSGRVNAELRNLRGTFYIGGKLQEPQLRR